MPPLLPRTSFYAALTGTLLVALCCFTPVLVIVLAAVGLSAFTPYLDYVLWPALVVLAVLTVIAYRRWKRQPQNRQGILADSSEASDKKERHR